MTECVALRVKDVDLDRRAIVVRAGKGAKDRVVPLGEHCAEQLRGYLAHSREVFLANARRDSRTTTPNALPRMYPDADRDWRWRYVFAELLAVQVSAGPRMRMHEAHAADSGSSE